MSHGVIKLKPEQNQGFVVTSPDEARLYSVTKTEGGDVFLEIEGGQTCQMPVSHPLFPAVFSGTVEVEGVAFNISSLRATATIPPDVIETVAKSFKLKPAELRDVLANMGPGQKYDRLAQEAEAKVAEAIQGGALARFLRSAKGKIWFMNKRAAIENLMLKGVPLSVTMASLLGVGELVDMAGINDPAISFVLVIKGAEFVALPVDVTMRHLYDRIILKRPFDLVLKRFVVKDAAGKVAGDLLAELPVKVGLGSKMYAALLSQVIPNGGTFLAKTWSVTTWPVRTLYGMGEGFIFISLYDAFLKDSVKGSLGGGVAEFGGFVAFFGRQAGDLVSGGYLSKGLSFAPVRIPLAGIASFVGAGFASFLLDSYVVAPIEYNSKRHANYMMAVSMRAAGEISKDNWFWKGLGYIAGDGIRGHLCSGRAMGLVTTLGDHMGVELGTKSVYDTCAYVRQGIRVQDITSMRDVSIVLKNQFKQALLSDGIENPGVDIWKKRIENGWFNGVDISPVQATNSRLFDVEIFQGLVTANVLGTDESNKIIPFLSDEFLEYKSEDAEEDEKRGLARIPMNMTIIPGEKKREFLNWLGGEQVILSDRRREFYMKLLWADIRRVAHVATEDDLRLFELGRDAGFISEYYKKFQADGVEREVNGYDFPHSAEYYEALAEIVQRMVVNSEVNLKERLQAYSQQRYRMVISAANTGSFQCTEAGDEEAEEAMAVAPYIRDLQILDPLLIDPGNEIAVPFQDNFLDKYLAVLPRDAGFEHAMNEYAKRWENYIKTRIGENIAVRKALGIQYTAHCGADFESIDEKYSETEFNSLAYFAKEDFGMGNDLSMCLGDDALDRSLIGMSALIKAFYNYAVLGDDAPESIAMGVMGEDGRLLDKARFARWVAKPAKLAYEKMTGSAAFAQEGKKAWKEGMVQDLAARLGNLKSLLARKWLMAIGERAEYPGRGMGEQLNEYINRPQNIEIRRGLRVIAAYSKGLRKMIAEEAMAESIKNKKAAKKIEESEENKKIKKIIVLIDTGLITPDGQLGGISAIEAWIKDDVIELAGRLIEEDARYEAEVEQEIERIEKRLDGKMIEFAREADRYQRLVKQGKNDLKLVVRLEVIQNSIMNDKRELKKIAMAKLQIDAMKAEVARLKAL